MSYPKGTCRRASAVIEEILRGCTLPLARTVIGCAVLAGCASSPPIHYYTLTEITPQHRFDTSTGTLPVRLDRIGIPGELDRTQLVRRIDPTQLQILDDHRWAAPLDDMILRVLSGELAARLPAGAVASPSEAASSEAHQSVTLDIRDFYADAHCAVALRAAWVIKAPATPIRTGAADIHLPADASCSGVASLPGAMSQALAQLSERLAAEISTPGALNSSAAPAH